MSKTTLVSTLPFAMTEIKAGLFPPYYFIPAAAPDSVGILVLEDGFHNVIIPLSPEKAPPMKVVDVSSQLAESLITDYVNSSIGVSYTPNMDGHVAVPGLFWVEGAWTADKILKEHASLVQGARARTTAWLKNLVTMADDDWARNHMHKTITDLSRIACKALGFERDWNEVAQAEKAFCWSCKSPVNARAITCSNCRAILNAAEYEKNKERFAKV